MSIAITTLSLHAVITSELDSVKPKIRCNLFVATARPVTQHPADITTGIILGKGRLSCSTFMTFVHWYFSTTVHYKVVAKDSRRPLCMYICSCVFMQYRQSNVPLIDMPIGALSTPVSIKAQSPFEKFHVRKQCAEFVGCMHTVFGK